MKKIKIYTLSTCMWCKKTKKYFSEQAHPYECVDYDLAPESQQAEIEKMIREKGGEVAFPCVLIDEEMVIGWNPDKYDQLLDKKEK